MQHVKRPAALLLDAGNTLVFLDHEAIAACLHATGISLSATALALAEPSAKRRYEQSMTAGISHAAGWDLHMRVLLESAGLPSEAAEPALAAIKREHEDFNLWRNVPAGLREALVRAKQGGIRLGIVSNSEGKLLTLLERVDLARHFELVVDSALEGVRKPDPAIFQLALQHMQVEAGSALYAGDIPSVDVDGARGAGMSAVLIDTLDHYPEYSGAPKFASVVDLLDALGV